MAHKHERTYARRTAVQVLYLLDVRNQTEFKRTPTELIDLKELDVVEGEMDDYAMKLIEGVWKHKDDIDSQLDSLANNWAIERMPLVDKNVLRVSAFELMHVDDVPVSVSIDEAVEIAKGFCGEESPKFINGILGSLADKLEE
jgi:transcription antitermination protein NusB